MVSRHRACQRKIAFTSTKEANPRGDGSQTTAKTQCRYVSACSRDLHSNRPLHCEGSGSNPVWPDRSCIIAPRGGVDEHVRLAWGHFWTLCSAITSWGNNFRHHCGISPLQYTSTGTSRTHPSHSLCRCTRCMADRLISIIISP